MPLKAGLKKKTEEEKEKSYTKQTNNAPLPKKVAQDIKKDTVKKTNSGQPSQAKLQSVQNRVANQKNYGDDKKDYSYRNTRLGKTSTQTYKKSADTFKTKVKNKAEETGLYVNKVDTTKPRKKTQDTTPTKGNDRDTNNRKKESRNPYNRHRLDEGAKDIQNRALSGVLNSNGVPRTYTDIHGRTAIDDRFNVGSMDDWGKFISNAMDSAIDYSLLGSLYTPLTGETMTNGAYYDNPYEQYRHQGAPAGLGRMTGMALNYGMMRTALNPQLEQAANAVMNGTKVGQMISNSSTLGKIGQTVGTNVAQDIGKGLIKETISDATLGFGQNALINYGEGLRGSDFWRQQAMDTALDFAVGGIMEGAGIGKQIKNARKTFEEMSVEKATDLLKAANTKEEYIEALIDRANKQMDIGYEEGIAPNLKKTASDKSNEFLEEAAKVDKMSNKQFNRYKLGRDTDLNTKYYDVRKGSTEGIESTKFKKNNVSSEQVAETKPTETKAEETPDSKPIAETPAKAESKPAESKPVKVSNKKEKQILQDYEELSITEKPTVERLTTFGEGDYNEKEVEAVLRKNGLLDEEPKAEPPKPAKGKPARTPSDRMAYKTLLAMPDSEEKWLALSKKFERDLARENAGGAGARGSGASSYIADPEGFKKAEPEYLRMREERLNTVDFSNGKEYNITKGDSNYGKEAGTLQQEGTEVNRGTYGVLQGRQGNDGVRQELLGDRAKGKNGAGHHKEFLVEDKIKKILDKDETIRTKTSLDYSEDVDGFNEKLGSNRKTAKYGYCVDLISKEDLAEGAKLIVTHDGAVTVGVNPRGKGGNIIGLSKSGNAPSGVTSHEAMMNAIAAGGDRSDQYGQALTNLYNDRYGLVPVAKVKYNEDIIRELSAPEEVEAKIKMFNEMRAEGNEPDVFVSAKFDDLQGTISTRAGKGYKKLTKEDYEKLPVFTDYEKALNYRDEILDSLDKRNAYTKEHGLGNTVAEPQATKTSGGKPMKRLGSKNEKGTVTIKTDGSTASTKNSLPNNASSTTASNGSTSSTISNNNTPPKGKPSLTKVGNFDVVGNGKGVTTTTPRETQLSWGERFKNTIRKGRRDFINSEAGLERMDKVAKQTKIQEKSYMTRNAKGQVGYILDKKLVDRQGNEIGNSLSDILGGKIEYNGKTYDSPYKDKATSKLFDEYAMELHNTYRAPQGKNIYGGRDYVEEVDQIVKNYPALAGEKDRLLKWLNDTDGTTSKEQRKALEERLRNKYENFDDVIKDLNKYRAAKSQTNVDRILKEHPEFAKVTEEMDKWWNSFTDEYLVKSGIISADNVKKFKEIYPHYVPTFRDMGEVAGRESKNAATLIKKATGSGKRELLTVPEQYARQVDRIVTAARRNELNQEIINTISRDPAGMKAFGAILDSKGKLTYDFSNGDLDDFITTLDDISLNQIKSGKNTITAVFNGEKVTANISDEVAKSLEAMSNLQDTNLVIKIGKGLTNPMKFTITGGNPVFFVSNMMRDLPTLYIQSNHGMLRTTIGLGKAVKEVFTNGEKYKMYKALGGAESGYYMRGKGFETTGSKTGAFKRLKEIASFLGEKGEAIPRMAEFINTLEKTGDAYKALRDAAESTVDFSRKGASDTAKALDAWTLYLNAGVQGLDKFARTVKEHPLRTAGRSATMLGVPFLALTAINMDNPYYQDLTERVKQNNFLIPNLAGEKDEDGYCKTFIKVPLNREYGTVFATSLYCALKGVQGEDDSWKGFGETFKENFLPNNPITDNILAPLLINIPQNKDFAGRSIIPTALQDASPENQYDYDTSGFAKLIAAGANKIPVDNVPILKYVQSPMLVDYILDSYSGYYGQVLQSATATGGTSKDNYVKDVLLKQTAAQPFLNKFVADPRYSSKPVADFYELKDKYTKEKTDAEINGETWSEAHAAEAVLKKISKGLYESTQAEKAILADKSLTKAQKDEMIGELRTAKNKLAKEAEREVRNAIEEYKEAPTFSALSDTTKENWDSSLKIDKEKWAEVYTGMNAEYDRRKENDNIPNMTADEKRLYLIEHGITSYRQAKSILGKDTSKDKWKEAVAMHKEGESYKSLSNELAKKAERQKNMTKSEIRFDDYSRARADIRYSDTKRKVVNKNLYDAGLYELQYVDKHTDNNGSITQSEAINTIENLDQMYGLTDEQKAYFWYLFQPENGWKKKPYGEWKG